MSSCAGSDLSSSQRIALALREARERLEAAERAVTEPIAIVGMGCRFPGGADSPAAYWERLLAGFDAVGPVPAQRYDAEAWYDPAPATPGAIYTREAATVDGLDQFDPAFFGISAREAVHLDPQQRLLLEVAWEALEHAGLAPQPLRGSRTGVFVGVGRSDHAQRSLSGPPASWTAWDATGNGLCYGPGRLAHVLDLQGPNLAVDTACSSSLVALHLACQSLRLRECNLALAGGSHVHLSPQVPVMMSMSRALAPDGRCKAFDASADGFGQGEGCGVVVLRRLSDALAQGDTILALIRGSAVNHDGHSSGLTVPNQRAQERVLADALAAARVQARDVGYVEAHGTGTALGDPIEVEALAAVLCGPQRGAGQPLHLGSVKTNIGHLEAAAGIAGLIKVVLSLQHGTMAPHLHLRRPNPRIDWSSLPIAVPTQPTPWPRATGADGAARPALAGVSSFGMSGTNAHVILEAAPAETAAAAEAAVERGAHVLALSARSAAALRAQAGRFAAHLQAHTSLALADVAHTANAGRMHFPVRAGLVASSTGECVRGLQALAAGQAGVATVAEDDSDAPGVAFLFSGQGTQYLGMGRELYRGEPVFRELLQRCDEVLAPELGTSLVGLMFAPQGDARLHQTAFTQPALFALQCALAALWRSWGVVPRAVLGHSVGEYAAACAAGVFGLEEGLRLVATRARLMQALPGGAMAALDADEPAVRRVLAGRGQAWSGLVDLAAVNGERSQVVSGPPHAVQALVQHLAGQGVGARALQVSHAFHSAMLEPMLAPLAEAARRVPHAAPGIALLSNLTGGFQEGPQDWPAYWSRHAREPVRFADGLEALQRRGLRVLVEIGPGRTLLGLAARRQADAPPALLPSLLSGQDEARTLATSLARLYELGVPLDWAGGDRGRARRRVALPTYPFERQRCWREPAGLPAAPLPPACRHTWERLPDEVAPAAAPAGCWWIVGDGHGMARALGDALQRLGAQVRVVQADAGLAQWAAPSATPPRVQGVVWACDGGPGDDAQADASAQALDDVQAGAASLLAGQVRGCASLLDWMRLVAAAEAPAGLPAPRLWLLTRAALRVLPADAPPRLQAAAVRGFARTLALEHPAAWGGTLDLPASPTGADLAAAAAELLRRGDEDTVALRGGQRWAARLEALDGAAAQAPAPQLRADASYLVTGGLGALGLQVADWLVRRGARHLVLLGRQAPSAQAGQALQALRRRGVTITTAAADVAQPAQLQAVLDAVSPPLRGVVHAAGVFGHEPLQTLGTAALERVLRPKVAGAWALHRLTAGCELDFFVLFSSVAAWWGSKGQAHYAAANAFLDTLAARRRAQGLPALSVGWGPWRDGGMATEQGRQWLARVGVRALAPAAALAALQRHWHAAEPLVALADVDWPRFHDLCAVGRGRPLLQRLVATAPAAAGDGGNAVQAAGGGAAGAAGERAGEDAVGAVQARLAALPPTLRRDRLLEHVQQGVADVLAWKEAAPPALDKGFFRLGMDSLMAVELRNRLCRDLGLALPATLVFDQPCIADLAGVLADKLGWTGPQAQAAEPDLQAGDGLCDDIAARIARLESLVRAT